MHGKPQKKEIKNCHHTENLQNERRVVIKSYNMLSIEKDRRSLAGTRCGTGAVVDV